MNEVTHRVYTGGFVVVPNSAVNDERLSFRARGLLTYMLGRPPGWRFSGKRLSMVTTEGREAVLTALRELSHYGYYRVTKLRDGSRWVIITEVASCPSLMPAASLSGDGFPGPGDPGPGNPGPYINRESQNRESEDLLEVEKSR